MSEATLTQNATQFNPGSYERVANLRHSRLQTWGLITDKLENYASLTGRKYPKTEGILKRLRNADLRLESTPPCLNHADVRTIRVELYDVRLLLLVDNIIELLMVLLTDHGTKTRSSN
jgi:hypothetical protein